MRLKEKTNKLIMSIPILALMWDMRKHQRYEPREGLIIEITRNDSKKVYAILLNISIGGMRILSSDKNIEDSKTISLSVDDFRMELPCETIWGIQHYYGIKFGAMNEEELFNLNYFIEHFTKELPKSWLSNIFNKDL